MWHPFLRVPRTLATQGLGKVEHDISCRALACERSNSLSRVEVSGDFISWKDEVMARPSKYPRSCVSARSGRWWSRVAQGEYPSEFEAIRSIAGKLGIGSPETLRKWVRRAEVDGGTRPGKTTEELAEIRELKKEVAELRRANEILKSASAFFAAELDRPPRY